MSLRGTIQAIKAHDEALSQIRDDRSGFIKKWNDDIGDLYQSIKSNLSEYNNEDLLHFAYKKKHVQEDSLGQYEVLVLVIIISSKSILASPVARMTAGSAGRVDLYRDDRTSHEDRLRIIREISADGKSYWVIQQPPPPKKTFEKFAIISDLASAPEQRKFSLLDKEAIEAALDYLLQID